MRLERAQSAVRMLNGPQRLKSLRKIPPSPSFGPPSPARLCPVQPRSSQAQTPELRDPLLATLRGTGLNRAKAFDI